MTATTPAVALVTGGSRGIGAEVVRVLARGGTRVVFTYARDAASAEALVRDCGTGVVAERVDASDPASHAPLVAATLRHFGSLDVLVNNAGIYAENPFDGDDFDAWRAGWKRTFDVNLFGAVDLAYHAMRAMRQQPPDVRGVRGRIVNVASRSAHRGETTFADYAASKAALVSVTKSIARGCARDGIVAFAVAPGFIATDMADRSLARDGDAIRREIPSGRIAGPDEVASIVAFLASGGGDYATGTTIDVNGASYVR
ncbi:MAG: SDR family oxidoreductase [Vulcanimicrobiaceae bacterium]